MAIGVSSLSGPVRQSLSGPTRPVRASFRFQGFQNYHRPASPSGGGWRGETDRIKFLKLSNSVSENVAHGRILGEFEDGSGYRRDSSQFGNLTDVSWPKAQFSYIVDTLPKEYYPSEIKENANVVQSEKRENKCLVNGAKVTKTSSALVDPKEKLVGIYDKVLVVDNISKAKEVVKLLTTKYRDFIHACDTEVAKIDVKQETPVGHGEVICFSIYCGSQADFGGGKSCIWVDVLDGGRSILMEFAPFFEDASIKKVWHNYSFDNHVIENYGIKLAGFHADTMHLARLWDSSRRADGGYSLEALTNDPKVISTQKSSPSDDFNIGKISMKSIFGKKKVKKDGSEGKLVTIAPVEELQREERIPWICYSALDSINTLNLFQSLKIKLEKMEWLLNGECKGNLYGFYEKYWRPFGYLLVKMEAEGMLVDRTHLSNIEEVAKIEQQKAAERFRKWASKHCPDAKYMNVGSDTQIRQLFFGGISNRKDESETLPETKTFKVPNTENIIEEGKKTPSKYRNITLCNVGCKIETEMYTASGWPSVSGAALKTLAGKVSTDNIYLMDDDYMDSDSSEEISLDQTAQANGQSGKPGVDSDDVDVSAYGTAYQAFGGGKEGREACHAIAALCEMCSTDSLISNFILPLQGGHISGRNGRIHCSLNINTETGRLSARRPNLQNQPALEKDRYKIRQAFVAAPGNSLLVADYGQLELRILAHLANCTSMLDAFEAGGDFHSRTAMNMYEHVRKAVEDKKVLLEWDPQPGEEKPPVPLLKDAYAAERRKAKMLNFSIAYGKTAVGLSRDWKVSVKEAKETVKRWYNGRQEVLKWQEERKKEAVQNGKVYTLLGRARNFPSVSNVSYALRGHIERAAINTPVQGSAADVAMCAMLEIDRNPRLKELGWKLLLQVHDEVILEGPSESAEVAKAIVVKCMSKPFDGKNFLRVGLSVDAKCAQSWYAAK
ncbi:DNA polymerase I A, chloroplastic-like isoform X2 [Asparagus officinalis]|uniref:DNA polymerase I A, chloroplastic-like isoform X1 n=1 Tax=Asparagus officinalis TaxID=4686 RepID=UPI00098E1AEB|nr:DNA polymerase I A, chloroplastic-like isoform X1 [Asparagus officinalis]XP_020243960.1 DNA polymerase I A, chloroplastic-like isoform X2 [Asparagus officinalis]